MTGEEDISILLQQGEQLEDQADDQEGAAAKRTYRSAASTYAKAAALAETHLGRYDHNTLAIRDRWAASLREAGELNTAITCNLETVERYKKTNGPHHSLTLDAQRRLAENHLAHRQYAESIKIYEEVVQAVTAAKRSPKTICQDRADLAATLFESGETRNVMKAVDLNVSTLQNAVRDLGNDHIETVKIRYNLGTELLKLSKFNDAAARFRENIEVLQMSNCSSKSHPDHAVYLEDSKVSLKTCIIKIARREKDKQQKIREEQEKTTELEQERKAEETRREKERLEDLEKEKQDKEAEKERRRERRRLAMEREQVQKEKEERQRLSKEKAETERAKQEDAERQRLLEEQQEQDRSAKEKAEQERLERERIEKEQRERRRHKKEKEEKDRQEKERLEREKKIDEERHEQEQIEGEKLTQAKVRREKPVQEPLSQEDPEKKTTKLNAEQEKLARRLIQERIAQEKEEQQTGVEGEKHKQQVTEKEGKESKTREETHIQTSQHPVQSLSPLQSRRLSVGEASTTAASPLASSPQPNRPASVSIASPVLVTQGLFKRLRAISDFTAKAAGSLSPQEFLPQRSHSVTGSAVRAYPDQDPKSKESSIGIALEESNRAEKKLDVSTQVEPLAPSQPVPIIRTDTANSITTDMIPGGWQQDFDNPVVERNVRKSRSNDKLGSAMERQRIEPSGKHRRASSADPLQASVAPRIVRESSGIFTYNDIRRADDWFDRLERFAHRFLDKYRDEPRAEKGFGKVKIAILDTGIAWRGSATAPIPELIKDNLSRVKVRRIDKSLPPWEDLDGHGTHAAGLILRVCPYAELHVYRVHRGAGEDTISKKSVADALSDAIDKKMDIVSMSFGWDYGDVELRNVIDRAKTANVLLFAASSNDGIETHAGMAYPARADEVIAIDAADGLGNPADFNPPQTRDKPRFTALGKAVKSAYPTQLPNDGEKPGEARMDGTSCATPIAAAIAGLVLEFARQRPLSCDPSVEAHLKSVVGMRKVFRELLSSKVADASHFNHLSPTQLFRWSADCPDGGEWCENLSPRLNAASRIVDCLKEEFAWDIGSRIKEEIDKELRRRAQT